MLVPAIVKGLQVTFVINPQAHRNAVILRSINE